MAILKPASNKRNEWAIYNSCTTVHMGCYQFITRLCSNNNKQTSKTEQTIHHKPSHVYNEYTNNEDHHENLDRIVFWVEILFSFDLSDAIFHGSKCDVRLSFSAIVPNFALCIASNFVCVCPDFQHLSDSFCPFHVHCSWWLFICSMYSCSKKQKKTNVFIRIQARSSCSLLFSSS